MKTIRRLLVLSTLLALLPVVPALADVFEITLTNGSKFTSRYRPQVTDWDENKVLVHTETGNRINLRIEDIQSVTVDTEVKGYGRVINTTTIELGVAPNDAEIPGQAEELDPAEKLLRYLQQQDNQPAPEPFTVQQFVEPNSSGGIPLGFGARTTPPVGNAANVGISEPPQSP